MFVDATSTNSSVHPATFLMNSTNQSSNPDLARLLADIAKIPPVGSRPSSEGNFLSDAVSGTNFNLSSFTSADWPSQLQTQPQTLLTTENSPLQFLSNSSNANLSSILGHQSASQFISNFQSSSLNDILNNNSMIQNGNWNPSASASQSLPSLSNNSNVTNNMSLSRLLEGQEILSMRGKNFNLPNNSQNSMRGNNRIGLDPSQLLNPTNNNNSNNNNQNSSLNSFFQATSPSNVGVLNSGLNSSPSETPAPVKMEIKNIISQLLAEKQANGQLGLSMSSQSNSHTGSIRGNNMTNPNHMNHNRTTISSDFNPNTLSENAPRPQQAIARPSPVVSMSSLPQQLNSPPQTKLMNAASPPPNLDANAILKVLLSTLSKTPKTPEDDIQQKKILAEIDSLTRDLLEKQMKNNGKSNLPAPPLHSHNATADSINVATLPAATNTSMIPPSIPSPNLSALPPANSTTGNIVNHELLNNHSTAPTRPMDNVQKPSVSSLNESSSRMNMASALSPNHPPSQQVFNSGLTAGDSSNWNLDSLLQQNNTSLFNHLHASNGILSPSNMLKRKSLSEPIELDVPKRESANLEAFLAKEKLDVDALVAELLRDSPRYPPSVLTSDAFRRLTEVNLSQAQGILDSDMLRSAPMVQLPDEADCGKPHTPAIGDGPPSKRLCSQGPSTLREEVAETGADHPSYLMNDISKLNPKYDNDPTFTMHPTNQEECSDQKSHRNSPSQQLTNQQRRENINMRLKELEQLIPGGNNMDAGTLLEAVLHHVKQLQLQIQMLNQEEYNFKVKEDNIG